MLHYKEVKEGIKALLIGMSNGQRLPGRLQLMKLLDASRATVDKAVKELEKEGVLFSRFGSGTYVARRLDGVIPQMENWCLIVPDAGEAVYAQLAEGVQKHAKKCSVHVILCNSERSAQKQAAYIERLIMAGVDGFIIVPAVSLRVPDNLELYKMLQQSKIPFVFCCRDVEGVDAPIVKSNDFYGGYMATLHLLERGYKNIVYLSRQRYRTSIDRCQGYISALQHRNQPIERKRIIMLEDESMDMCCRRLEQLIQSDVSVDAVFGFNDTIALMAMEHLKQMGLQISKDIGVIGYDDLADCLEAQPPLTSVAYQMAAVGEMAARVLGKMIDQEEKDGFAYYLIEPEIQERESCLGKDGGQDAKL